MLDFWFRIRYRPQRLPFLAETYQVLSSASVDELWGKMVNLADMSWHPLLAKTNVPYGLIPKPGLIFQAVSRLSPIPIKIFVERVSPGELLSVRVLAFPGLEERVTYRIESTLCGTQVSYSVTLKGWLSPLIWSIIQPYAAKVARDLAHAAEQDKILPPSRLRHHPGLDWLGSFILLVGLEQWVI
ncbi:MAG: SRPBCC family protein [Elainella sp.]